MCLLKKIHQPCDVNFIEVLDGKISFREQSLILRLRHDQQHFITSKYKLLMAKIMDDMPKIGENRRLTYMRDEMIDSHIGSNFDDFPAHSAGILGTASGCCHFLADLVSRC
jgi:hypothetical protein